MDAGTVAVNGFSRTIGRNELIEDGIVSFKDARAVHEFTDTEDAVICQRRFHVFRFKGRPAVVKRSSRHTGRHHEMDIEGCFFSGLHHVFQAL